MEHPLGLTADALAAAEREPDLESLAAGRRMRDRFGPELAAAALTQAALRRRGRTKFGAAAATMFFTRDGLEQATRPAVARHHARRMVAAGVGAVVDLGCGIGADSLAFADAGLAVRAVERASATAEVARANLGSRGTVEVADAAAVLAADAPDPTRTSDPTRTPDLTLGWFADPARRNAAGRVWRETDFSPSWDVVLRLTDGVRAAGVKLGPALPHRMIPATAEAEWVSQAGTTLEACLWSGPAGEPGRRRACVLDADGRVVASVLAGDRSDVPTGPIRAYLHEPDGAVIRAGALPVLAAELDATGLDPQIAYLSSDIAVDTPLAVCFEVLEELPHRESVLRSWVRDHRIGTLEIKQRGIDLDPARLRRRLAPKGPAAATFVITRTPQGARVLVVRRVFMR